jgi:rRNA maturation RNase YbeY
MSEQINFFYEGIRFRFDSKKQIRKWIKKIIKNEKCEANSINIILCDDDYLLKLNRKYLNRNTLTDIICFPMIDQNKTISGDIFISIQRVKENAKIYKCALSNELSRVIAHGILHLLGYNDRNLSEKKIMNRKEEQYLDILIK